MTDRRTFRIAPELCPIPWVRRLPDAIAPANPNRWQSYIGQSPSEQFQTHPTEAEAYARLERWELSEQLRAHLRGQTYQRRATHPAGTDRAVA